MSFERSYSIESHERTKLILIFGDKSLLLTCWVTYMFMGRLVRWFGRVLIPRVRKWHWVEVPSYNCFQRSASGNSAVDIFHCTVFAEKCNCVMVSEPFFAGMLVLVLKDSLRTFFKSLSWSLGVLSWSLWVRSLSWSLWVRSLSLPWSLWSSPCPCF